MDSDLAWVNGLRAVDKAEAFQRSIISEAIYHLPFRFWKLLFAVSYSMGLMKCDVKSDIFWHAIISLLNYHQLYCAQALVTCTLLKLIKISYLHWLFTINNQLHLAMTSCLTMSAAEVVLSSFDSKSDFSPKSLIIFFVADILSSSTNQMYKFGWKRQNHSTPSLREPR